MADERDDEEDTKSSKRSKKRFQERDDSDEDDDRPQKKRRRDDADDEDDQPRSKRKADDAADDEDDRPKKKRVDDEDEDERPKKKRRVADDGPRVKSNDNIPVLMLLAFIGSAVALLASCVGCGWFSFGWLVGGGDGGGGGGGWGGGNEFEVTATRQQPIRPFDPPTVGWSVTQKKDASDGVGQYYLVMKVGTGQPVTKLLAPTGKGWSASGGGAEIGLKGNGKMEVWVEKRPNPVAIGKVVSNVFVVP